MNTSLLLVIVGVLAFICIGVILYLVFSTKKNSNLESLLNATRSGESGAAAESREFFNDSENEDEFQALKDMQRKQYKSSKNVKVTEEERMYHAGMLLEEERQRFKRMRMIMPFVGAVAFSLVAYLMFGPAKVWLGLAAGVMAGITLPSFYIDRRIAKRGDEIMYYLPLVIEQVAIGVSSSLDIGPCLQRVVQMADERDSHNVVTELVRHAEQYIRSGVSLSEALAEIGVKSGHTELKHTFMALGQVAKHGGEISHQLHELGAAVSSQRETQIEAKIKKLELKATGPVALVFLGFIMTLMAGLVIRMKDLF